MRHGEYIALGKIEAILKTCAAVSNIVVYGSGTFIILHMISIKLSLDGYRKLVDYESYSMNHIIFYENVEFYNEYLQATFFSL